MRSNWLISIQRINSESCPLGDNIKITWTCSSEKSSLGFLGRDFDCKRFACLTRPFENVDSFLLIFIFCLHKVILFTFYLSKSPLNHHLGNTFLLFPTTLSKSKLLYLTLLFTVFIPFNISAYFSHCHGSTAPLFMITDHTFHFQMLLVLRLESPCFNLSQVKKDYVCNTSSIL